jgi:hypothetical protein
VPYVKISRDKRGYETYYLIEPASDRSRQPRPRILFWFRTPPQVKVGREPFSEEIRQAIETQNPDLKFDWPRLMATSPPPIDDQRWRERRRLERAARQAARDEPEPDVADADTDTSAVEELPVDDVDPPRHLIEAAVETAVLEHPDGADLAANQPSVPAVSGGPTSDGGETSPSQSRRRRRRRRGRRHGPAQAGGAAPEPSAPEPPPPSDEV